MSLEIPRLFWPLVIADANDSFEFQVIGGGSAGTYTGEVAAGAGATYQDPETFYAAVQTAMNLALAASTTITMTAAGVITITFSIAGATSVQLHWTAANCAALGTLLGFDTSANDTGAMAYTADYQMQHFWTPNIPVEIEEEVADEYTRAIVETAAQQVRLIENGPSFQVKRVEFSHLPPERVYTARESGSTTNQAFQRFISDAAAVVQFRWWPDRATTATYTTHYLREDSVQAWRPERMRDFGLGYHRYRFGLDLGEWNA